MRIHVSSLSAIPLQNVSSTICDIKQIREKNSVAKVKVKNNTNDVYSTFNVEYDDKPLCLKANIALKAYAAHEERLDKIRLQNYIISCHV